MLRIRRACYDKPHRCPGWAGGGFKYAKTKVCENGYIPYSDSKFDRWSFKRCTTCGTVRLPIVGRWVDPTWLAYWVKSRVSTAVLDYKIEREWRARN
jgi:hypothetical protein